MGAFEKLEHNDRSVEATTKAWLGERFDALEQPFDTLFRLFWTVHERPTTQFPDGPFQSMLLYSRTAQHLWTAWRLGLSGHYLDAVNALKIANECSLLALLFVHDGAAGRRWQGGGDGFRPKDVRDALSRHLAQDEAEAKPLAKGMGRSYSLVCEVAHPNPTSVEWIRQGLRTFSYTGTFEAVRCGAVMVRLIDELSLVIQGLARVVIDAGCEVPRDHIADLIGVMNRIRATFEKKDVPRA